MSMTNRDMEILALSFSCIKDASSIKVDYQKLAEIGGFKTAASACATYCGVKKKLLALAPADLAAAVGTPKKSNTKAAVKPDKDEHAAKLAKKAEDNVLPKMPGGSKKDAKIKVPLTANSGKEASSSPTLGGSEDRATTPANDSNLDDLAAITAAPKHSAAMTTATDRVNDDSTPTKATPKKRTPKVKVKMENDAEVPATPKTPVQKKRTSTTIPDAGNPAGKRARKTATDPASQFSKKKTFASAIAASQALQKSVLGDDEEEDVGNEDDYQHIGVKDLKTNRPAALPRLAHQDGMFPDHVPDKATAPNQYMFKKKG